MPTSGTSLNQPGLVRAELANAVSIDSLFTLDGLLFALIIRSPEERWRMFRRRTFRRVRLEHGREAAEQYFRDRGWPIPTYDHALPLGVWGHGCKHGLWVYCSSYGFPSEEFEHALAYWTRRIDSRQVIQWVENPPKRIEVGKGPYRSYRMPLPLFVGKYLTWYVRGDLGEIERILAEAPYFGKKRSQGYGRVKRWVVEPLDEDRSVWYDGNLMRPVPAELLERMGVEGEFEFAYCGYRPPYHDVRYFARCAVRGKRFSQTDGAIAQKEVCENTDWARVIGEAFGGEG